MTPPAPERLGFTSDGERCAAWLYSPPEPAVDGHPIVVMAHGFGGTHAARLWAYGERFAAAGLATLVFDYRFFGESEGEPRQLLSISRQQQDWRAAINFARTLPGVDPERVAIWGTSFGGGHVIEVAAGDPRIKAVVSQTPFVDGIATLRVAGAANIARLTVAGVRDVAAAMLGREPYRAPIVAHPGETGAMTQPASYDGYMALHRDTDEFRNEVCARVALAVGHYRPITSASKVACPLLVVICEGDDVVPPDAARRAAELAPQGQVIAYGPEWNHFDIYVGELFERTVVDQIDFLREALGVEAAEPAASA